LGGSRILPGFWRRKGTLSSLLVLVRFQATKRGRASSFSNSPISRSTLLEVEGRFLRAHPTPSCHHRGRLTNGQRVRETGISGGPRSCQLWKPSSRSPPGAKASPGDMAGSCTRLGTTSQALEVERNQQAHFHVPLARRYNHSTPLPLSIGESSR
jgi:hypothetical protein